MALMSVSRVFRFSPFQTQPEERGAELAGWEASSPSEGLVRLLQLEFLDQTPSVSSIHTKF